MRNIIRGIFVMSLIISAVGCDSILNPLDDIGNLTAEWTGLLAVHAKLSRADSIHFEDIDHYNKVFDDAIKAYNERGASLSYAVNYFSFRKNEN